MAKIGTVAFIAGSVKIDFNIFYSKTEGFYATVPKEILEFSKNTTKITATSYQDAEAKMVAFINTQLGAELKQEKVIIYYLAYAYPSNKHRTHMVSVASRGTSIDFFSVGETRKIMHQLQLQHKVKYIVEFMGKKYVTVNEIASPSALRGASRWKWSERGGYSTDEYMHWDYIPYTEQAEDFFKTVEASLTGLVEKVADFFGDKPENLLENIEKSDNKLLIYEQPKETN